MGVISWADMERYSLFMLKVSLNTNQPAYRRHLPQRHLYTAQTGVSTARDVQFSQGGVNAS